MQSKKQNRPEQSILFSIFMFKLIIENITQIKLEEQRLNAFKETVISKGGYPNQLINMTFKEIDISYIGNTHSDKSSRRVDKRPDKDKPSLSDEWIK